QFLGDKYWATLGAKLNLSRAFTVQTGYEWYWKTREQYEGVNPAKDYAAMADGTNKYLETWQLGASLSSIPSFLDHKFPLPADISFDAFIPLRGRNQIIAPYGVAQLALYF